MAIRVGVCIAILVATLYAVYATDPSQLQDFCVATNDPDKGLFVNGKFCKDPSKVDSDDFLSKGALKVAGDTNNRFGFNVTRVEINSFPALNTLGVSLARIDLAPYGLNTPHIHPRATEVTTLIEGVAYVGFIASNMPNGGNRFFTKVLYPGDVFVFPQGTIHFEFNVGKTPAVLIAAFSSQNPGVVTIANAMFGSTPPISDDVLTKAFQLDKKIIDYLQATFPLK